ncbi:EAL domain-containing protein [Rhodoferax saidenbachensis]|uniref:cyclic-guanylate-specific phosphodiesterase n=1 Tax=Rhodoferax saidenbachensis TaxID=1484693 RepID=A0ABU1ZP38_9BURK|nr:EAL domain-containing protein [Rhodoferax saidenbachensis]MDR7307303.1 sensor c-di-GMP phosphodiesterase-like protein [Rhodoferax saidenbachensis]
MPFSSTPEHPVSLTRLLGRHPTLVGALCGFALALALAAAVLLLVLQLRVQEIEAGHAQIVHTMQVVQTDIREVLDELNQSYKPECSPENLNQLRSLLFSHRYARDIGLLDPQRQLFCNTSIGLLAAPRPAGTGGIDGSIGRYYRGSLLQLSQGAVASTVVERGLFQVAIQPNATRDVWTQHADSVWAGAGNQRTQVFKGKPEALTQAMVAADTPHLQLDWGRGLVLVTTTEPGVSPISAQSAIGVWALLQANLALLVVAGCVSLLLGFLTSDAVRRRCRHYQSMEYRIHDLCNAANLECHYQPILELATGRIVGCEVLARLRDRATLVYPDQFIPALMRQKLAWTFDAAVSAHALRELGAHLPVQPGSFKVALNFFPHNLQRDVIHNHLQTQLEALRRSDLQIELEVTEYNFSPEIVPHLQRLKADGYLIALDDFGTGYSNLGMVKKVAPDFIKIDKSFVFEMEDVTLRSSLIPEIIGIAKAVHSQVIAEGIETAAQAAQLRALGVEYGQGYFFARPMPLTQFLAYLQSHRNVL